MPKWTDYTIKTNPADKDEMMILDTAGKANKRLGLSALSDWILNKLADKVFQRLETDSKTVLGAINELNSKAFQKKTNDILSVSDMDSPIQGIHFINGAEILNQNRYGVFLHFETTNNAAKYQKVITTTGETFERTYGRTTGWTGWFEK